MNESGQFAEVDISGWPSGGVEQLGTKPKQWRVAPDGAMWLFKEVTWNRRPDGSRYAKGDDWSERVAAAVADALGLPTAHVELALRRDGVDITHGIISRKVLDDSESLIHGNELLAEIGVRARSPKDRTGYTVEAVRDSLRSVAPPTGVIDLTAWDYWVGYSVLDALVGNTDRHQANWAVIGDGLRRLAPTFDHASCLGFLLDDEDRSSRLATADRNRTVEAYVGAARSKFEGQPHPCDVAVAALGQCSDAARGRWIRAAEALTTIDHLLEMVPPRRASPTARNFAGELYRVNRALLLSHPLCNLVI